MVEWDKQGRKTTVALTAVSLIIQENTFFIEKDFVKSKTILRLVGEISKSYPLF